MIWKEKAGKVSVKKQLVKGTLFSGHMQDPAESAEDLFLRAGSLVILHPYCLFSTPR